MRLSVVIITNNRSQSLDRSLRELTAPGRLPAGYEILVVDNGSTDGTVEMLREKHGGVQVVALEENRGKPARNVGIAQAQGDFILFVDDDSYPLGETVPRALGYLEEHMDVGALTGRVLLPDGRVEASALPSVFIACGVIISRRVLMEVGGFPEDFFRQAEEYDLSFRILNAGYSIRRFEDLEFRHEKTGANRAGALIHRLDIRNNLVLLERYVPTELRRILREDWAQRYGALARHAGHMHAARLGWWQAQAWRVHESFIGRRILSTRGLEAVFGMEAQERAVAEWAQAHQIKRVLLADFAKTLYFTFHACRQAGLEMTGIAENHRAFQGMSYHGLPVVGDEAAAKQRYDGVVLANLNPGQVGRRKAELAKWCGKPVLTLWEEKYLR